VIWLNAWALIGLVGIALPVLIHLLARGHARTHRFPSLRFIDPSQLLPTRRTRVQDPLLLALRCTIVGLAALALAQPVLPTTRRKQAMERGVARAIVVDTSASMRRLTPSGSPALDSARRAARILAGQAQASIIVETNDPAQALQGAAAWLAKHYERADLVVISDFQVGQLDSNDVRAIPSDVSVTPHRVPVVSAPALETQWAAGDGRIAVRATVRGEYTDAEWTTTKESRGAGAVTLLGAETDQPAIGAMRIAAATTAVLLPMDTGRAVTIVLPRYVNRRTLDTATNSTYVPWMVDLLRGVTARRNDVQRSGVAIIENRRELVLFTDSAPASLPSARIAAAANAALSAAPALEELEPETLSDRELSSLARGAPGTSLPRLRDPNGESDARWLWAVVFVLLLIELPLRRRLGRQVTPTIEGQARAA
jgi:hypothetical protein